MLLMDRLGRKLLLLWSFSGMVTKSSNFSFNCYDLYLECAYNVLFVEIGEKDLI